MSPKGIPSVYVVSMRRRKDRQAFMVNQLHPIEPLFSFEVARDYDGSAEVLDWGSYRLFPWQIASNNFWWNRPLKLGEIGCFLAHIGCWQHAASQKHLDHAFFFEDDAFLQVKSLSQLHPTVDDLSLADPNWDLLYFGRNSLGPDRGELGEFVSPGYSYLAHAYALSRRGLEKILAYKPETMVMPADEFLPATFMPHPRRDIADVVKPLLNAYATRTTVVGTVPKEVFGSDTELG